MKPSWWLVVLVSFMVSSLIVAGFVIARFWLDTDGEVTEEVLVLGETNNVPDLDSIPEGNEDLVETTELEVTTTFTSRTLPITFSYPSDWQIWEGTTPLSDYIQIADFESKPLDALADKVPGHKLEIALVTQPLELSLEKWIKQTDKDFLGTVGTIEDLMIDGFPAKLDYQVIGYSTFGSVYIPLGDGTDRVILISLYGPEATYEELRPLFDSILETVQITAQ